MQQSDYNLRGTLKDDDRDPRVEWRYAQRKGAQKAVEVELGVGQ